MELNFRELTADELDCRVGTVTDKGVSLLMYKDARVDMRLLGSEIMISVNSLNLFVPHGNSTFL